MRRSYLQLADCHIPILVVLFLMARKAAGRYGNEALRQATGGAIPHEVKHVPRCKVLKRFLRHSNLRYDGIGEESVPNRA